MPIGPAPDLASLASQLNPRLLRLFMRDLLTELGFRELRDFDGPGDGGRDLEGIHPEGGICVIQLKHREDPNAATSTNEAAELPMSLSRLGRTKGLFVTNGKLSAPAKRDLVNAYPGLSLEFMEGIDLLAALERAPVTVALWVSGATFRHILRRVSFGVICREFPRDRSIFADSLSTKIDPGAFDPVLGPGSVVAVSYKRKVVSYSDFEPFRAPKLLTTNEGIFDAIFTAEVSIHGDWTLDQLPAIQDTIARYISTEWSNVPKPPEVCAVRVGRPTVWAAEEGDGLKVDRKSVTWVGAAGNALPEKDAFCGALGEWQKPSWIQTYQAMRGLYYLLLPGADILCHLRYTTMTTRSDLGMALRSRAYYDHWWSRSICCLSPDRVATDSEVDDPFAPHFSYKFCDVGWVTVWLHPRLQGQSPEYVLRGDERDAEHDPFLETAGELRYLATVGTRAEALKAKVLDPHAAHHALCFITGGDAAPSVMWRTHDTGTLLDYMEQVPSPVDPFAIECEYAAAYVLETAALAEAVVSQCSQVVDATWRLSAVRNPSFERDHANVRFLAGTVDRSSDERLVVLSMSRTVVSRLHISERLAEDASVLPPFLRSLEREIVPCSGARCSRQWLRERWRVYFSPERPGVGDEQVWFDSMGRPMADPSGSQTDK